MARGVHHGCFYLKKGYEHKARPLSPTLDVNSELLFFWELDNYDGARRTTQSLLPQEGTRAYGTTAITHCRMQTWDFFGNLIIVMARGVRHGRYYLKKGCEHTAWLLSPTVECEHTAQPLSPTIECEHMARLLPLTVECEYTAQPLSPTGKC